MRIHSIGVFVIVIILGPLEPSGSKLPLFSLHVLVGFPSPAADHLEKRISLDEQLDAWAPHVYLVRMEGNSMIGAGIYLGDLVIVDRSIEAKSGHIVIAAVNCELLCKRLAWGGIQVVLN